MRSAAARFQLGIGLRLRFDDRADVRGQLRMALIPTRTSTTGRALDKDTLAKFLHPLVRRFSSPAKPRFREARVPIAQLDGHFGDEQAPLAPLQPPRSRANQSIFLRVRQHFRLPWPVRAVDIPGISSTLVGSGAGRSSLPRYAGWQEEQVAGSRRRGKPGSTEIRPAAKISFGPSARRATTYPTTPYSYPPPSYDPGPSLKKISLTAFCPPLYYTQVRAGNGCRHAGPGGPATMALSGRFVPAARPTYSFLPLATS